jgi:2,3-dihydroxy-2,3-dihydrophenylpropionate dehydrogenase
VTAPAPDGEAPDGEAPDGEARHGKALHGKALHGKAAAVVGGGSGIGRAVVEAFLAAGASVAVLERDPAKCAALRRLGPDVAVVEGDARSPADTAAVVGAARRPGGHLDVAAGFVGVFDLYTPLRDIPDDRLDAAFDEVFGLNVKTSLVLARAALPALREGRGCLLLTLSSSSFYPGRGGTLYVASKFALRGVVCQLAHEEAPHVRVNGVAPGGTVGTDLRGAASLGLDGTRLDDRPGRREQLEARTPLHVALGPADHAGAYVYLASDAARGVTGEVIRSDGGLGAR